MWDMPYYPQSRMTKKLLKRFHELVFTIKKILKVLNLTCWHVLEPCHGNEQAIPSRPVGTFKIGHGCMRKHEGLFFCLTRNKSIDQLYQEIDRNMSVLWNVSSVTALLGQSECNVPVWSCRTIDFTGLYRDGHWCTGIAVFLLVHSNASLWFWCNVGDCIL